jgi:farnesyl-diphosphate farnesyltransferase
VSSAGSATRVRRESPTLLDQLLKTSSRTFALTIPLLHEPTRREVTVAYLLFRVADSLEDSTLWPRPRKVEELEGLALFLERPSEAEAARLAERWTTDPPLDHPGYLQLLAEFPEVMRAAAPISAEAWRQVSGHTARTCRAMATFVAREEGGVLHLRDLQDLKGYCYAVAGIVGEMLTELFLLGRDELRPVASEMRRDAAAFGEALQLVNILKDRAADAVEGRHYLPAGVDRAEVFALARRDLVTAAEYCARLETAGADRGLVAFTALPLLLARATLDRVQERGAGAKVTRDEVAVDWGAVGALVGKA